MKQGLFKLFVAIILSNALPLFAVEAEDGPIAISDENAAAVEAAMLRGYELYRYDQAAWHTTDAMMEDLDHAEKAAIRGWVITEVGEDLLVTYWKKSAAGFEAVYSARYDGRTVSERTIHSPENAMLTEEQISRIHAQQIPDASKLMRCGKAPFNTVTFPTGKQDGSYYVYFLVPQETLDSLPLGGHFRFEVRDGQVVGERGFTKGCYTAKLASGSDGERLEAVAISHLLDPIPTEIHAFSVYAAGVPIIVIVIEPESVWQIATKNGIPFAERIQ